jgi:hypothetical protein
MARRSVRFVVCVDRGGNEDLQVGRIYRVLPDAGAKQVHYVRIVDDSEEDYLYPSRLFLSFHAPPQLRQALEEAGV